MVLFYAGTDPIYYGKVLKIPKESTEDNNTGSGMLHHNHVCGVIHHFFSDRYLTAYNTMTADAALLVLLEKRIWCDRPVVRRAVGLVKYADPVVLTLEDNAGLLNRAANLSSGSIVIELKVKCGFSSMSPFVPAVRSYKHQHSRFKLMQWKKLTDKWRKRGKDNYVATNWGKFESVSTYDPLDLCAGSSQRVSRALDCLMRNPQNNLKVSVCTFGCRGDGAESGVHPGGVSVKNKHIYGWDKTSDVDKVQLENLCTEAFSRVSVGSGIVDPCISCSSDEQCDEIRGNSVKPDGGSGGAGTCESTHTHEMLRCVSSVICKEKELFRRLLALQSLDVFMCVEGCVAVWERYVTCVRAGTETSESVFLASEDVLLELVKELNAQSTLPESQQMLHHWGRVCYLSVCKNEQLDTDDDSGEAERMDVHSASEPCPCDAACTGADGAATRSVSDALLQLDPYLRELYDMRVAKSTCSDPVTATSTLYNKSTPLNDTMQSWCNNLKRSQCVCLLHYYLVALAAKDASVLIAIDALQGLPRGHSNKCSGDNSGSSVPLSTIAVQAVDGGGTFGTDHAGDGSSLPFTYRIQLADIGPKRVHKIIEKQTDEEKLHKAVMQYLGGHCL